VGGGPFHGGNIMKKGFKGQGSSGSENVKASAGIIPNPKLKLLDQVREVLRLLHYSLSTE